MSKKQKSAFHNTDLGRSKPKRHFLKTFVDSNLKQPRRLHSDTGLVVDRTSPATVIRVILGLIVLHLVIIGGVMARGSIAKSNSGLAIAPTITPPPAARDQHRAGCPGSPRSGRFPGAHYPGSSEHGSCNPRPGSARSTGAAGCRAARPRPGSPGPDRQHEAAHDSVR